MAQPPEAMPAAFRFMLSPWYESIKDPTAAQETILKELLENYGKTEYGRNHSAENTNGISEFRINFPIIGYRGLKPYLEEAKKGNYSSILSEPPACWVMTRGSTGVAKVIPATQTHLQQILFCGARAFVHYAVRKNDLEVLSGRILNLNFPSLVTSFDATGQKVAYGYSSGTYARLNPALNKASLVPRQEDIDSLGAGITKKDWEARFELVYQKSKNENVVATMGVAPVILSFARYVKRKHNVKLKDLWKLHALFLTSVAKIHSRYAPLFRSHLGEAPIVEIYSATEGVFAQQLDDLPYVVPNYDAYLFEVKTGKGMKMLHELKRGEWGRIIISSTMFPRYNIGDMVEGMGKNYFRIFGRSKMLTLLEHRMYRLLFGWLI